MIRIATGPGLRTLLAFARASEPRSRMGQANGVRTALFARIGRGVNSRTRLSALRSNWLLLISVILFSRLAAPLYAQQPATEEGRSRFRAVDIFIDSKSAPLAAWQIEFAATNGVARIVGIEGGETEVFRNPPFYDPKAMQHERVIIAAFSTADAQKLPTGKTRVATIHLQIVGDLEPQFKLTMQTAADPSGNRIAADATLEQRNAK